MIINESKLKYMLKAIIESIDNKIYYHGRNKHRPYNGTNYIYITDSLPYAAGYGSNDELYKFTIPFDDSKLFSIKNPKDVALLRKHVDSRAVDLLISISNGDEADWAGLTYIENDDYATSEELLESLGYYGIKLKERPGIESILIFNQNNLNFIGKLNYGNNDDVKKQIQNFNKDFAEKYNLL